MSHIACCFFYTDERFDELAEMSSTSFKAFHPDIDVHIFNYKNFDITISKEFAPGYAKFCAASSLFDRGYDKVISLGVDTITCARLDEFIENEEDVLVTLDFPYSFAVNDIFCAIHFNGDVICFNNRRVIEDALYLTRNYCTEYYEQGAIDILLLGENKKYSYNIVDAENVIYNCRYKGCGDDGPYAFTVTDGKIYTKGRQLKVLHFVNGIGKLNKKEFEEYLNGWKFKRFNEETKNFMREKCNIGFWFDKQYEIHCDKDFSFDKVGFMGFPEGNKIRHYNSETRFNQIVKELNDGTRKWSHLET
jgi:hypothetical protein